MAPGCGRGTAPPAAIPAATPVDAAADISHALNTILTLDVRNDGATLWRGRIDGTTSSPGVATNRVEIGAGIPAGEGRSFRINGDQFDLTVKPDRPADAGKAAASFKFAIPASRKFTVTVKPDGTIEGRPEP